MFAVVQQTPDTVCIFTLFNPLKDLVVINRNNFSLGEALACYDFFWDMIFKYLDRFDLKIMKQVNSQWNQLAQTELNKRISSSWIAYDREYKLLHNKYKFFYNDAVTGIVFYNYEFVKLDSFVCLHGGPDIVRMTFAEYTAKELMQGVISYFAIASVPIHVVEPTSEKPIDEHDPGYLSIFQSLLLPPIPDMNISLRHYSKISCFQSEVDDKIIRCMLIFAQHFNASTARRFLQTLQELNGSHSLVFGGGLVNSTKCFFKSYTTRCFSSADLYCILFTQKSHDADFDSYSVIMHNSAFESELDKFRSRVVFHKYGVVYSFFPTKMIANGNRTVLLREYFPEYQHVCLEVPIQIGISSTDRKTKDILTSMLIYTHSVVVVVTTWGTKI